MAELTQEKDDVEEFERKVLMGDPTELRNAFYLFDGDVDGKLSEDEVVYILTRKTGEGTELSEEVARATWQRWVAKFDLDKDGKISYMEIVKRATARKVEDAAVEPGDR